MKQSFKKKLQLIFSKKGAKIIWSVILLALILPISLVLKKSKKYKNIWLIGERENEATDNGYALFSYIIDNNLHSNTFYIIKRKYSNLGQLIKYKNNIIYSNSIKHNLYYSLASMCISTQTRMATSNSLIAKYCKNFMPVRKKYVYLGHGLLKDHLTHLHVKSLKADLIIIDSYHEKEYLIKRLGYKKNQIALTGRPRHDLLTNLSTGKDILIFPTNRLWISSMLKQKLSEKQFYKTLFYKNYQGLLNNEQLLSFAKKNNKKVIFYLHPNIMPYAKYFTSKSALVTIIQNCQPSIQYFIKHASMLVTDYSSVAFDFVYLNKPIIYFQFDKERFLKEQYPPGWFSYEQDGFGPILSNKEDVVNEIISMSNNGFILKSYYKKRTNNLFAYHDGQNRKRTVKAVQRIIKE